MTPVQVTALESRILRLLADYEVVAATAGREAELAAAAELHKAQEQLAAVEQVQAPALPAPVLHVSTIGYTMPYDTRHVLYNGTSKVLKVFSGSGPITAVYSFVQRSHTSCQTIIAAMFVSAAAYAGAGRGAAAA